ncbi:MAG: hypothetical protein M3068_12910 [Gemmatimonadota bacterium]|nr:hypothetical protein [Gemmatimonadota bacterium]
MRTTSPAVKWLAIAAIVATGLIHVLEARDSFSEATYKGALFVANGIGAAVAAYGIQRGRDWGWLLGVVIAAGALLGYVASRTIGLPGLPAEPDAWLEPIGVASLACELLFLATFAVSRTARTEAPS